MKKFLDDISLLQIEISALKETTTPTDEDYSNAIRQYFEEVGGLEDWMVDILLKEVKEHIEASEYIRDLMGVIISPWARIVQSKEI